MEGFSGFGTPQVLDAGPRGGAASEVMSALSTGGKKKLCFFKGDAEGTAIGAHTVHDFMGNEQSVGMVQTWNQCNDMLLTSMDKRGAIILMDTETGATKSELNLKRQQKNWGLEVDSITPMDKFGQYEHSDKYCLYGLGDSGKTVFFLNHDTRMGENVEEFVIHADSHRKYKSVTFTCHAQTRAGHLALGRSDGAVALYDAIMSNENASCVLDGMPGPVTSVDAAADGSMVAWTTAEFVFFTCLEPDHWTKKKIPKPRILQLVVNPEDEGKLNAEAKEGSTSERLLPKWTPIKFDAGPSRNDLRVVEREIIAYSGTAQVRWNVRHVRAAWEALNTSDEAKATFDGVVTVMPRSVYRHMTVGDDMDVVALEGEIVKSLRF
ncbi:hypothetical protein AB1Y20_023467 [Prymnesium parvum]|uniref:Vacuolar import/degradation Vid27 C-terminal domain-containing protein n=1 Tax=Prymnesium parvum TaxID=97485 RepID=A0AB34JGH0_PRYPA